MPAASTRSAARPRPDRGTPAGAVARRRQGSGVQPHGHGTDRGLILAELSVDVVKIEPAPNGDHTRGLSRFGASFFAAFNRNKRSLAVDVKRNEEQAVIHRLAVDADVVHENALAILALARRRGSELSIHLPPSGSLGRISSETLLMRAGQA